MKPNFLLSFTCIFHVYFIFILFCVFLPQRIEPNYCDTFWAFSLLFPKESELIELRETIEMLKAQNSAAQAAIQGALNGPDHIQRGMVFCLTFQECNGSSLPAFCFFFSKEWVLCHICRTSIWKCMFAMFPSLKKFNFESFIYLFIIICETETKTGLNIKMQWQGL